MSLRKKAISGVRWNFFGRIGSQVFQFIAVIILARILTPEDFGLVGMTIVFTGFIRLFRDAGFGSALIQRLEVEERHLSSVFWANVALGILLATLIGLAAPAIAAFFNEPQLVLITRVIALDFAIGSLSIVQLAQLQRALAFKKTNLLEMQAKVLSGLSAIGLALTGFGVWSLVLQSILYSVFLAAATWYVCVWRPRFQFELGAIRELLGYSTNLLAFNIINYWTRNADNLLVGKIVGSAGLGIYTRAYGFMMLPLRQFANVIGQVMFPVLSRVQGDIPKIKAAYLKANRLIALVTVPLVVGLFVTTESFILTLLGPKWVEVIPILQILCLTGVKQPLGASMGWLLTSMGRTDTMRKWALLSGTLNLIAVGIGVQWGVMGVAIGYVTFGYVIHYHSVIIPSRLVDVSFKEFHTNVASIFGCAMVMGLVVFVATQFMPETWPYWLRLISQVGLGVPVYVALVHLFRVKAYQEFRTLLPELTRVGPFKPRVENQGGV